MPTVSVLYSRRNNLGSLLIRAGAWFGPWSHCSLITPQNTVIEAVTSGVREVPVLWALDHYPHLEVVTIEVQDPERAYAFARAQLGKPYDWGAIAGFITRRNWQDDQRWECTELVEASLIAAGRVRWRERVYRIHPTLSYNAR